MKKVFSLFMLVLFIILMNNCSYAQKKNKEEIKIKTSAVCSMCKDRIEQNLAFEKGISDVSLDVSSKIVTVKYNSKKTNPDKIRLAISKIGYDADDVPADKVAYGKLPACCKKDAPKH
jgi:periplasmic mercuric ion binding protein